MPPDAQPSPSTGLRPAEWRPDRPLENTLLKHRFQNVSPLRAWLVGNIRGDAANRRRGHAANRLAPHASVLRTTKKDARLRAIR
jgi:hypothetical protein